jgi:hypothetical protein
LGSIGYEPLVTGFLNEVVQRLDHAAISTQVHEMIEKKFAER